MNEIPVIRSILDTDLYKLSMQQAVLECFPNAIAEYEFIDRNNNSKYSVEFLNQLRNGIKEMQRLTLLEDEESWLSKLPWIKPWYLTYLGSYQFDPTEVKFNLDCSSGSSGKLRLSIKGPWHKTILWEVPLLALISELYFDVVDKDWITTDQQQSLENKGNRLTLNEIRYSEFGTRRRRSFGTQNNIVQYLATLKHFCGTSNLLLAKTHNVTPVGTVAHEWTMAHGALISLQKANKFALMNWNRIYNGQLGIALTDTYGTQAFLEDFDGNLARSYDGVRQDSGDPNNFMDRMTTHYHNLGIDPTSKTYSYTDALDIEKAIDIKKRQVKTVGADNCWFGIGTHFTNDFRTNLGKKSDPLNIVIKLRSINGKPAVKLSDSPGKSTGDFDTVRIAKHFFFGVPLDAKTTSEHHKPEAEAEAGTTGAFTVPKGYQYETSSRDGDKRKYKDGLLSYHQYKEGEIIVVKHYLDGKLHRVGGPAVEYSDGRKEFYVNGVKDQILDFKESLGSAEPKKTGMLRRSIPPEPELNNLETVVAPLLPDVSFIRKNAELKRFDVIKKLLINSTGDNVVERLGGPDDREKHSHGQHWYYNNIGTNLKMVVEIRAGRVENVRWEDSRWRVEAADTYVGMTGKAVIEKFGKAEGITHLPDNDGLKESLWHYYHLLKDPITGAKLNLTLGVRATATKTQTDGSPVSTVVTAKWEGFDANETPKESLTTPLENHRLSSFGTTSMGKDELAELKTP